MRIGGRLPEVAALVALVLLVPLVPALAQERAFEVVPPDKAPFNYPSPPREGRPDCFILAENGQARCVIVQPAGASKAIQRIASCLAAYLQLATGAGFSVVPEGGAVPEGMAAIHVGDTSVGLKTELKLPDLPYGDEVLPNLGGYLIKTLDPRTLVIRGRTETATAHGVVGFLKRYAGVRQYWVGRPGSLGDVIPSRPTLRVPEMEWRDWPYFFSRALTAHPFLGDWGHLLDFYRRQETLPCSENYDVWLPPQKYAKTNPEFFSLVFGKRLVPSGAGGGFGWQPCASNPNVARIMGDAVADYFRKNPDAVGINFAINDGGCDCTCEACRAMDAPNTDYSRQIGMSDRYVKLTNQVCERVRREFPSKMIVYLAYAAACAPPQTAAPDPMLLPVLTVPGNAFDAWDRWMKTGARHMGLYLHHDDIFFILPKFDLHQTAKRIRYAVASGRARVLYEETHTQWPFNDIAAYVLAELLWDPRQDVEALLNEYYTSFYGPAAEPMRAFHRALESGYERWLQEKGEPHWFGKDISSITDGRSWEQFRVLNLDEASQASAALAQATLAGQADSKAAERVQIVSLMFGLQELAARQYWTAVRLKEGGVRSEADARRVVEDARTVLALSRQMSDYIQNVLEKPPADAYALFKRSARKLEMYEEMKSGQPSPEALVAVSAGVDAATSFLRKDLGPQRSAAWWRRVREAEKEQVLAAAFQAAEMRSKGVEIKNLAGDPGFEEIARKLAPNEFALDRDIALPPDQEEPVGIHQWFPERSPYRIVLTKKDPHSGRYCLMIEHCHRARVARYAPGKEGDRFRVGLWFKHNAGKAIYKFAVDAALTDNTYPTLVTMPVPQKPDQWQELVAEVVAPPRTRLILLRLFVNTQAADARCWLDDLFVGQYPK